MFHEVILLKSSEQLHSSVKVKNSLSLAQICVFREIRTGFLSYPFAKLLKNFQTRPKMFILNHQIKNHHSQQQYNKNLHTIPLKRQVSRIYCHSNKSYCCRWGRTKNIEISIIFLFTYLSSFIPTWTNRIYNFVLWRAHTLIYFISKVKELPIRYNKKKFYWKFSSLKFNELRQLIWNFHFDFKVQ